MTLILFISLLFNLLNIIHSRTTVEEKIEKVSVHKLFIVPDVSYIVDGSNAKLGQYPFMVSLQVEGAHICGGNLVNMNTIVTAAHCLSKVSDLSRIIVVAGVVNLNDYSSVSRQTSRVVWGLAHKDFVYGLWQSDIALLKVRPSFEETLFVSSIRLPPQGYEPLGIGTVVGFGATAAGRPINDKLMKTMLSIFPYDKCRYYYGQEIDDTVFCADGLLGTADTCQGDSGGPLICNNYLCGIIAAGIGCGNPDEAGIYTKVSHFTNWINTYLNTEVMLIDDENIF
uniref:Secreted S1 protease protein n=1 Tax=Pristhesancus plagipennis TaxID=1955184 RepID=A0A2K8JM83_PRIPG|nr:secreted S1 protease protein [Pristhesancus plagipennis]